jgi:outer membrane protein
MRRWIAAMALLALYPAVARGADMLNLPDAISMAIDHAPSYAAAAAGRDAAQEQRTIGRAWLLPYVHATGGYAYYRQKYGYSNPNAFLQDSQANFNRTQGELTVSQPLFDLSRLADYRQGKLAAQAGDIRFDVSLQQLLLGVSQAYVRVVVARSADQAARAQEQAMDKLAEQATAAFKAGTKNINDSLEAESRLDLARAARIQADNDVAQAEAALTSLIGPHTPNMAVFSTSAATPLPQPDDVAHWQSLAAKDSPYVRLAANEAGQAHAKVTGAIGTAAPSLSLVGAVGYDKATGSAFHTGTTTRTERIGVELSVPLYAGGGTWAQLRLDEKLASKAELDLEEAKRQARLDAQAAFLAVHAAQAQVTALSQAERSARKARQAAVLGYQVGLRDIVERLDAEERLYSAVHELTQARGDYLMARLRLASSVGRLDQAMIRKTAANLLTAPMTDAGDQSGMRMAP